MVRRLCTTNVVQRLEIELPNEWLLPQQVVVHYAGIDASSLSLPQKHSAPTAIHSRDSRRRKQHTTCDPGHSVEFDLGHPARVIHR